MRVISYIAKDDFIHSLYGDEANLQLGRMVFCAAFVVYIKSFLVRNQHLNK